MKLFQSGDVNQAAYFNQGDVENIRPLEERAGSVPRMRI